MCLYYIGKQLLNNQFIVTDSIWIIFLIFSWLFYMSYPLDEEALSLLLKCPKKKYIKHLIQYAACLNLNHNNPPRNFKTPIIETFKTDLELTSQQSHKLLHALSQFVQNCCAVGFDLQSNSLFSEQFDQQLKQVLTNTVSSMQAQIEQSRANSMKIGNKLIDFNWKLDLQVANQKGKSNVPNVSIQIESINNAEMQVDKIQMKGEQFQAFFNNMKKIKQNLLKLVQKGQQGN